METRLWIDDAPVTEEGAADALPRYSSDWDARVRLGPRPRRPDEPLDSRPRRAGEIPGSVEDIQWSPDGTTLLVLAADLGSDRAGAQSATKISEAGAEEAGPEGHPARNVLAPALPRGRRVGPNRARCSLRA